jgi:integrase
VIAGGDLQPFSQEAPPLLRAASSRCCFAPLLEKAGLPTIHFHDLRHTCATLLLISNVSAKVVSEMPGHARIAITLGTYSRVLPTVQGGATRALEDMLR